MARTATLLVLSLVLCGCASSIPDIVRLDELPADQIAEIDAVPEVARDAKGVEDLGAVEAISCNRGSTKEPASWEDAVRRTKFRALQKGGNAIAELSCGLPKVGPWLSRVTGYVASTCTETIRCAATAMRKK